MNIQLAIDKADDSAWTFRVTFVNDGGAPVNVPVDAIQRRGDRTGLRFAVDGVLQSPAGFAIAVPARDSSGVEVPPGQRVEVAFSGRLERRGPDVRLCFLNAEYKIEKQRTYQVFYDWGGMQSNTVNWSADAV